MPPSAGPALLVHGGAGEVAAADPEGADAIAGCRAAARAGYDVLARGGSALDAAVEAVRALEDDARFNAGLGSVLNLDGDVECDASVMTGDGQAGAVACVRDVKNPVRLARLVMQQTPHVLLAGAGAEAFGSARAIERTAPGALVTEAMRARWLAARARQTISVGGGTVGCVARDGAGRLAAATSTGGTMLKLPGRVGDSALIGAGTYAADGAGAVSCTGAGEAFIKAGGALRAVEAMRAGRSPTAAAEEALAWARRHGGSGGVICVSATGQLGQAFDTPRMAHAWIDATGVAGGGFRH